jgi:hypothetical protein
MNNINSVEITLTVTGPSLAVERYQSWVDEATDAHGDVYFADLMLAAGATCVLGQYCDCLWYFVEQDMYLDPTTAPSVHREGEIMSHTRTYSAPMNLEELLDELVQRHPDLAFECV